MSQQSMQVASERAVRNATNIYGIADTYVSQSSITIEDLLTCQRQLRGNGGGIRSMLRYDDNDIDTYFDSNFPGFYAAGEVVADDYRETERQSGDLSDEIGSLVETSGQWFSYEGDPTYKITALNIPEGKLTNFRQLCSDLRDHLSRYA